jgi:uncharacterized protein with HEPN domain
MASGRKYCSKPAPYDPRSATLERLSCAYPRSHRVTRYTGDIDESAFLSNQLVQDAVIRNFEILGEACNNIEKHYPEFTSAHPELPLSSAYEMRNAVAHGYFKVDFAIVWKTLRSDLPGLHDRIQDAQALQGARDVEGRQP